MTVNQVFHLPDPIHDFLTLCGARRTAGVQVSAFWNGGTCRRCRASLRKMNGLPPEGRTQITDGQSDGKEEK